MVRHLGAQDDASRQGQVQLNLAIITGASKGIGRATARRFVQEGYSVVNISRTHIEERGVINCTADLSVPNYIDEIRDSLDALLDEASTTCLVHNAASMQNDSATSTATDSFRGVIEVNLIAMHSLNQLVVPNMKPSSSVIYIGSTLAEKAVPGSYSYVISKHAMIGMMRAMCQDLAGSGIHTACLCPGFTDTEMLREHVGDNEEVLASIAAMNSFGRLIDPVEIADAVYFAAKSPVTNGSVIHANLGQIES